MRVVSINQPHYFPWLGLLDKIYRSDVFIILDSVQYSRHGFQNRTLYSTETGPRYLTVPVRSKGHLKTRLKIADVKLADSKVLAKHFETLRYRYYRAPGWPLIAEEIKKILTEPVERLVDLSIRTLNLTLSVFGIQREIVFASSLDATGSKSELVFALVEKVGGDVYLSGSGAKAYMDDEIFCKGGIKVHYQQFDHPIYPQSHGADFQPRCFALEWFLEDPDSARKNFYESANRRNEIPLSRHA